MTLHALRRRSQLSLTELSRRTGISVRRLAEYEYEAIPLNDNERAAIAAVFGVGVQYVASGVGAAAPTAVIGARNVEQAYALAALASAATLAWALHMRPTLPPMPDVVAPLRVAQGIMTSLIVPPTHQAAENVAPVPETGAERHEATPSATPGFATAPITAQAPSAATATNALVAPTATEVPTPAPVAPHRCPVDPQQGRVVIIGAYDAGTHMPAATNGALDLAIDSDGNGVAETWSTRGVSVVAAHAGTVTVELDSWPTGNNVIIEGEDGWRSAYAHLQSVAVQTGARVESGQLLGTVGNTGQAGGPHLDVKVWHNGANVDPTGLLSCS